MTKGEDRNKNGNKNWQLCSVWKPLFCNHRVLSWKLHLFYQSVYQSPCSVIRHSWKPRGTSLPAVAHTALRFSRDVIPLSF